MEGRECFRLKTKCQAANMYLFDFYFFFAILSIALNKENTPLQLHWR